MVRPRWFKFSSGALFEQAVVVNYMVSRSVAAMLVFDTSTKRGIGAFQVNKNGAGSGRGPSKLTWNAEQVDPMGACCTLCLLPNLDRPPCTATGVRRVSL